MTTEYPGHIPYSRGDLRGPTPVFLLEIEWLGRVLRWSSRAVTVYEESGAARAFSGGLPAVQPEVAIDMLGQEPAPPRVSMEVLPPPYIDVAQAIADGHRLDNAVGELSWWVPGTKWERRLVIVRAPLSRPTYGGPGEPVGFTLEPEMPGEDIPIRSAGWVVSGRTAGARAMEPGEPGPWVVGSPGARVSSRLSILTTATRIVAGSPAPRWTHNATVTSQVRYLLLTYGHIAQIGPLYVYADVAEDPTNSGWDLVSGGRIETTTDETGQPVTLLDARGLDPTRQSAQAYYVCWRAPNAPEESAKGAARWGAPIPVVSSQTITSGSTTSVILDDDTKPYDAVVRLDTTVTIAFDGPATVAYKSGSVTFATDSLGTATTLTTFLTDRIVSAGGELIGAVSYAGSTTGLATLSATRIPRRSVGVDTLGDLLAYAARRTRVRVDVAAFDAVAPLLRTPVAGYIDDATTWWELITEHLAPIGPITWAWSRAGYRPVYIRYAAGASDAVWHLTEGRGGIVRLPGSQFARDAADMARAVRVRWAWDARSQQYGRVALLRANPDPNDIAALRKVTEAGDAHAEIQDRRYPRASEAVLESRWIHDERAAFHAARFRLAMLGASHRLIEIEGPADLSALRLGDVVTYTSSALRVASAVAHVVGLRWTDVGRVGARLAFLDHPAARATTAGPGQNGGPGDRIGTPIQ